MKSRRYILSLPVIAALALMSACVNVQKNGKGDNVDVKTPFGSVSVRTDQVKPEDTGLHVYPGAVLVPKHGDNDEQANVNVSSPWGGVKVIALKYHSDDSPDKVLAWYRKDLQEKYSRVLECKGNSFVGFHGGEQQNLSCEDNSKHGHGNMHFDSDSNTTELKTGTDDRQHIVAVKSDNGGSNISLVFVEKHGEKDSI